MNIRPLGDRVVLKKLEAEETTKSGISSSRKCKRKPQEAEVVAVGLVGVDGKEVVNARSKKVGWGKVIISKYSGYRG